MIEPDGDQTPPTVSSSDTVSEVSSGQHSATDGFGSWSSKCVELMHAGVTIVDPSNTIIDPEVEVDQDTTIFPGCELRGKTRVASYCQIGPYSTIIDSEIGEQSKVLSSTWVEGMRLEPHSTVGPFERLIGKFSQSN